jgi:hypothetical protein
MIKISAITVLSLSAIAIAVHLSTAFAAEANEWEQLAPVQRLGTNDDGVKPRTKLHRSGGADDGIKPLPKVPRSGTDDDSLRTISPLMRGLGVPAHPTDRQPARSGADDSI